MASAAKLLSGVILLAATHTDALVKRAQEVSCARADDETWMAELVIAPGEHESHAKSGTVEIKVHPEWAPLGAARFAEMLKAGNVLDGARFFRVVPNFMVQFGIPGNKAVSSRWRYRTIRDDPVKKSNKRGFVTFATSGKDARTTQIFINYVDNAYLDGMGFAPFAEVTKGMDIIDAIYAGFEEKPNMNDIQHDGNAYLNRDFPQLTYIQTARIKHNDDAQAAFSQRIYDVKTVENTSKDMPTDAGSAVQNVLKQAGGYHGGGEDHYWHWN
eukprot:gnl/TRDRNA2_/TRDRNA2_170251_c0_seq1.p1 gnl/TRDRNA2_/TRDRNA2_170251_c0~~gnl/TRDRNA2_/TRDRNA2_170251_c0_seq1.p1  ORF type:complete len:303 (+),score=50.55 gnl/TRDRNA2_/TRDRNA2_170251_c0_seq1:97-909(+)